MKLVVAILSIITVIFSSCKTGTHTVGPNASNTTTTKASAIPCHPLEVSNDLEVLLKSIGNARIVLLGEDTHGTSEYYNWRADITKRLIEEKAFNIIALEADWTDTYRLNDLFHGARKDSDEIVRLLKQYNRWPSWLWANHEFAQLLQWMNAYTVAGNRINIYGLDVYSFEEALDTLINRLKEKPTIQVVQNVKQCLRPYFNALKYKRAVQMGTANCGAAVNRLWLSVNNLIGAGKSDKEENFLLQQNARLVFNGERYFRETVYNRLGAWNIRDRHMEETITELLRQHGGESKIIVWAHNSHIGDAHFTDMPGRGRSNMGEMLRKDYGNNNVFIVGFGSYKGSVIAAQKWDTTYQVMQVAPARPGSIEELLHNDRAANKIIISKQVENNAAFSKWLIQRAIGVVENPRNGLLGTYVTSQIQKRYDAFIYFDETHPIHPLD